MGLEKKHWCRLAPSKLDSESGDGRHTLYSEDETGQPPSFLIQELRRSHPHRDAAGIAQEDSTSFDHRRRLMKRRASAKRSGLVYRHRSECAWRRRSIVEFARCLLVAPGH